MHTGIVRLRRCPGSTLARGECATRWTIPDVAWNVPTGELVRCSMNDFAM